MSVIVFLGPSLPVAEARTLLDATYRPPASQGDVLRATLTRPWAIALIDGYFERMPAVWHKELLWAMTCGIHVYGASSMGALRAAELAAFGMEGEGEVFEAFRDGTLEDDDEVAVVHGPAEAHYLCGSEALVNIRATLRRARGESVIRPETHDALIAAAKVLFYPHRSFERVLAAGLEAGVPELECDRLKQWLPAGRVDIKREDARALLERIAGDRERALPPKQVAFRFQRTLFWNELRASVELHPPGDAAGSEVAAESELLDELRLQGETYERERALALDRLLLARHVETGSLATAVTVEDDINAFRAANELAADRGLEAWLAEQGLTPEDLPDFVGEEARLRRLRDAPHHGLAAQLRTSLRLRGLYAALAVRAREKRRVLARWGLDAPALADARITEAELWQWYFETMLSMSVPDDLAAYARRVDCNDVDHLRRVALRERLFRDRSALVADNEHSPVTIAAPAGGVE